MNPYDSLYFVVIQEPGQDMKYVAYQYARYTAVPDSRFAKRFTRQEAEAYIRNNWVSNARLIPANGNLSHEIGSAPKSCGCGK